LSFKGLISDTVLARKQKELEVELARVSDLLAKAQQHADDIEAELAEILDRTKTPHATYLAGTPLERRILNQTFFKRILVGEEAQILGVTLTPAYAALAAWQPSFGQPPARLRGGPENRAGGPYGRPGGGKYKPRPPSSGPGFELSSNGGRDGYKTKPSGACRSAPGGALQLALTSPGGSGWSAMIGTSRRGGP
jgi:hypothetical protein